MKNLGKVIATIECRMTSTRLPGKVLMEMVGKPVLELMVERVKKIKHIDEVVLATTTNPQDDKIEELAESLNIGFFRGSENRVLERVAMAAKAHNAQTILLLTGDCPLIDFEILSQLVELYRINDCDRVEMNTNEQSYYPDGLGAHILDIKDLLAGNTESETADEQEHPVLFYRKRKERFKSICLPPQPIINKPEIHITLDEKSDFEFIKNIYENFYYKNKNFRTEEILNYLEQNPQILNLVKEVKRTDVKTLN